MYRFLIPFADGSVWNVAIGAKDLTDAVDQYQRYHWNPNTTGAVAVYFNHCLEGRIIPVYDEATDENRPRFEQWQNL